MKLWLGSILTAVCVLEASVALAAFHLFRIDQIYSNADGTVQFVVLSCAPTSCANGENFWAGQSFASTHAGVTKSITFPTNLPSGNTSGKKVLIGSQGFAALGLVAPDYAIPNGFLATDGGTVRYAGGVDQMTYTALPTDGTNALYRNGSVANNLATNFAGASASVVPVAPPTTVNYQGLWWASGRHRIRMGDQFRALG